jgi:hypothetical protein
MPKTTAARGTITLDQIAALADHFDRFVNALPPVGPEAEAARRRFETLSERIYRDQVAPHYRSIDLATFRAHLRTLCRQYLAKNKA